MDSSTLQPVATGHQDLVHDLAFDYYGRTLATCSSDRHIRVFTSNKNQWVSRDSWKAHDSAVVKLAWAPPEYGQILASVSYDRTLKIWEHKVDGAAPDSGLCFKRLKTLSDAQAPLFDVAFAPGHLEVFKVATIGLDCELRIYQAFRSSDLGDLSLIFSQPLLNKKVNRNLEGNFTVNWSTSIFTQEKFCASAINVCSVFIKGKDNKYALDQVLSHPGIITDVAWAPSMGRSFELLATACKDGFVRVYKVVDKTLDVYGVSGGIGSNSSLKYQKSAMDTGDENSVASDESKATTLDIVLLEALGDHKSEVWSVSWNSTGTILSSTGDDGKVRFWKADKFFRFNSMAVTSVQKRE